jgi:hypothetical protein
MRNPGTLLPLVVGLAASTGCAPDPIPELRGQACLAAWQEQCDRRKCEYTDELFITPEAADPLLIIDEDENGGESEASLALQFYTSPEIGEDVKTLVQELIDQNRLVAVSFLGDTVMNANPDTAWNAKVSTSNQETDSEHAFVEHQFDNLYTHTDFGQYADEMYASGYVVGTSFFYLDGERNPEPKMITTLDGDSSSNVKFTTDGGIHAEY